MMCRPSASQYGALSPLSKVVGLHQRKLDQVEAGRPGPLDGARYPRVSNSPVNTSAWHPIIDGIPTQPPYPAPP